MKLIRVDETGVQHQYLLPSLEKDEPVKEELKNTSGQTSTKEDRIKKMLEASGKNSNEHIEFSNKIEPNFIYASISGYEYIKMDINEFLWFIKILNALIEIDADDNEFGFYGINLFVAKIKDSGNTNSFELVQFELDRFPSDVLGMTDALRDGRFNEEDPSSFFEEIKYLG